VTAFTIILPHRRNPGNDAALKKCLDCLFTNTENEFILIIDAAYNEPLYPRINRLMTQATTEAVVYWSSDIFAAPGWDAPMLELYAPDVFVTSILIEPGVIGVYPDNIHKDFGRRPETFNREAFEGYCVNAEMPGGLGWYAPVLYPRTPFLDMGGLATDLNGDHHGFTGADMALFDAWKAKGNSIVRARSFAYHLQRWSEPVEQIDAKRELHV